MQATSWADQLELVGDDDRLVGFAGALPLRLLGERSGLRAGLSAAMARRGFDPVYDRGAVAEGDVDRRECQQGEHARQHEQGPGDHPAAAAVELSLIHI